MPILFSDYFGLVTYYRMTLSFINIRPFMDDLSYFQGPFIYSIGLTDDPSEHCSLDCFLYSTERQTLFNLAEYLIPFFMQLNRKEKYNILTEGINKLDPEYFHTNLKISLAIYYYYLLALENISVVRPLQCWAVIRE